MERYQNNLQDQFGNAIPSVTVTVRRVSDGGVASIFSDNSGTGKANPFTNDGDGEFFFYAADGRYNIFFTGPITDQKDDVLLQDTGSLGPQLDVRTDIVTATPPTTEAVSGGLRIFDLDATDQLAQLGYSGSNILYVYNWMHGGAVHLSAQNGSGLFRDMVTADPAGNVTLRDPVGNVDRLDTHSTGRVRVFSDDDVDASQRSINLCLQDETVRAQVGHIGATTLSVRSLIHGAQVTLTGEDAVGDLQTIFAGDPDGESSMMNAGVKTLAATQDGEVTIFGDLSTNIDFRVLYGAFADGTVKWAVGQENGTDLALRNEIHGGIVHLSAEDSGGIVRFFIQGDPDALTEVMGDTDVHILVNVGAEIAVEAVANGKVGLRYNAVEKFRTALQTDTDMISGGEVAGADGTFQPVGLGVIIDDPTAVGSGAQTPFQQVNAHQTILHDEGAVTSYTTYANTGASQTDIPAGAQWEVKNDGAGVLTILGGTSVVLDWYDGGGVTPPTGTRTLARGGRCVVRKINDSLYEIWGNGLT